MCTFAFSVELQSKQSIQTCKMGKFFHFLLKIKEMKGLSCGNKVLEQVPTRNKKNVISCA